jgi:hypothetical protein
LAILKVAAQTGEHCNAKLAPNAIERQTQESKLSNDRTFDFTFPKSLMASKVNWSRAWIGVAGNGHSVAAAL